MSSSVDNSNRDVKKLLGGPKITFILGGPASGKGTQCAKLVEEFGYTHISTGDLMRIEIQKGSKEGERIKKIVNDGGLVPFELTVQVLINGMIANPSKNYLIDGFPRAVDQAIYFEQNVGECQNVVFYNVSEEVLMDRCLARAKTSGRADDNPETLIKRLKAFNEQSKPVVDLYKKFGKVHWIDAFGTVEEVYEQTKQAMMPKIFFIIGPQCSGKTALGSALAERTNMRMFSFAQFLREAGLKGKDDEAVTLALIKALRDEIHCRVLVEGFPQNEKQAVLFQKNCQKPHGCFLLKCSKDVCQERMLELGSNHPNYCPSSILTKKIKSFNENLPPLKKYIQSQFPLYEIDSEQPFSNAFRAISQTIEPQVIHVRSGGSSNETRKEIVNNLVERSGFVNLEVNSLIRDENERRTATGLEFLNMVSSGKIIPAEMIVRMLRKIIYSNQDDTRFILSNFPDIIEQVREFEKNCSQINAIVYASEGEQYVEIKNNNLTLFNIDALFQKEFRLKTMSHWDKEDFENYLSTKNFTFGIHTGYMMTGKTYVSNLLVKHCSFIMSDLATLQEKIKKGKGTEEEPFEGEISTEELGNALYASWVEDQQKGLNCRYIIDNLNVVKDPAQFFNIVGMPCFVFNTIVGGPFQEKFKDEIFARYKKKNEVEELGEEQQEEVSQLIQKSVDFTNSLPSMTGVDNYQLASEGGDQTIINTIKDNLNSKVILVNHEKRLTVDTTCANLAIKYKLIYLSVYQLIKNHIEGNTEWGIKLLKSKKVKDIKLQTQAKDEFNEFEYSAVHFDLELVVKMLKQTVEKVSKGKSKMILIEGLCNSNKLIFDDDRLDLRFMDEIFAIEKHIGDIIAIVGLQFQYEKEQVEDVEFEKFPEPEVIEKKPKADGEEGEEEEVQEQPPAEEEEDKKVPKFKVEDYAWTITDRQPKNLPQLFNQCKGVNTTNELKTAEQFSSSQYEAISKCLDEFCNKVIDLGSEKYLYQQVIFNE